MKKFIKNIIKNPKGFGRFILTVFGINKKRGLILEDVSYAGQASSYVILRPWYVLQEDIVATDLNITFNKGTIIYDDYKDGIHIGYYTNQIQLKGKAILFTLEISNKLSKKQFKSDESNTI